MTTTIQVNESIRDKLTLMKLSSRETYNDVLERLFEDLEELDAKTRHNIERSLKEIEDGQYTTHEQLRTQMGF